MKLSDHCYAVTGLYFFPPWSVNAGFIVGNHTTLIVDSGSNALSAQTVHGYAMAVSPANTILVINTEKHLDHLGGNGYFRDHGVKIYGHALINRRQDEFAAMVEEENSRLANDLRREGKEGNIAFQHTRIVNPDIGLREETSFDLGGVTARVLLTPGHTATNLSVLVESEKVIYCGDCVVHGFMPNVDEADLQQWKRSLNLILGCQLEILVPGHGNVLTGYAAIAREIRRIEQELDRVGGID